jgi:5-hydroxyisourate hydrolase-like protein (transthyretin family)
MTRPLIPVAIVAAAAAGLLFLLDPFSGGSDPSGAQPAAGVAMPDENGASARTTAPLADAALLGAAPGSRGPELAATAADPVRRREASEPLRTLAGRVVLPPGLPADHDTRVQLFDRAPSGDAAGDGSSASSRPEPRLTVTVTADGQFEADLPGELTEAWLVLDSRYLVADGPLRTTPDDETPPRFEPKLGAWLTGTVRFPAGAEPAEEAVESVRFRPDPLANAGTPLASRGERLRPSSAVALDATHFEIRGLRAGSPGDLEVSANGYAAAKLTDLSPKPGEHLVLEVRLTEGATLAGRVVDESGKAVADAEIEVRIDPVLFGQGGFEVGDARSDAEGRFRVEHVMAGPVKLRASRDGLIEGALEVEVAEGERREDLELTMSRGNLVRGTVRWSDGAPAPDVEVELDFDASYLGGMEAFNAMRGADGQAVTDAEGDFEITGLGAGPFVLTAKMERDGRPWSARLESVRPGASDLLLTLEEPLAISGRVLDDRGEALTDFEVLARTKSKGLLPGLGAETHKQKYDSEDGSFLLDGLRPGAWEVLPRAEGHAWAEPVTIEVPLASEDLVLVLPRGASAAGRVVDPAGLPVKGAAVGVKLDLAKVGRAALDGLPPSTETDELGAFELTGLSTGTLELYAAAPGYGASAVHAAELEPGQALEDLVLRLRTGGRILGVLIGEDGRPTSGASILCQDPSDPTSQLFKVSDSLGEFTFEDLAPGSYQVMTFGADPSLDGEGDPASFLADMKFTVAEVHEGEDTYVTLGATASDPVEITGKVMAGGSPAEGALVTFMAEDREGPAAMKFNTTDGQGEFATTLDQPGAYLINVQKIGGTGQQQTIEVFETVPDVERHRIDLELPVAAIRGRVTGPDGAPAAGVRVTLAVDGPLPNGSMTGGQYAEVATDSDGRYELVWLREGTYSVAAGGALLGGLLGGDGSDSLGRKVRRDVRVQKGQVLEGIDFDLDRPGSIRGLVTDEGGAPVSGVAIFLRDAQGNVLDRISMVRTDSAGRFNYGGLEAGSYEVTARSSQAVSVPAVDVTVREGETSETRLQLDVGTTLLVTLTDREAQPVRCRVLVTGSDGRQVNGLYSYQDLMDTLTQGGFSSVEQRVGPLPPGKYTIQATADDGRDARKSVNLSGQQTRRVKLRLD